MHCPFCDAQKESLKVIDSRTCEGGRSIRRRRQCLNCNKRFTTYERIEDTMKLTVVKRDGRRVPWDRNKIFAGLERACFKRPVPEAELWRLVDEVEEETFRGHDREVPSTDVGTLVAEKLRRLDQVAYVRFASVYKQFKTLEELVEEAKAVIDAKRFEDPTQGRLFIDPSRQQQQQQDSAGSNGGPSTTGEPRRGRGRSSKTPQPAQKSAAGVGPPSSSPMPEVLPED
jgi:transcriptional repressor NrdR